MIREYTMEELFSREEFAGLVAEYSAECKNAGLVEPSPDKELYCSMYEIGVARVLGAEHKGLLVGFAVVLAHRVAHYSAPIAVIESLFVSRDYRASGLGWRMVKQIEALAAALGVMGLFITAPRGSVLEASLHRSASGYENTNTVFFKQVKGGDALH